MSQRTVIVNRSIRYCAICRHWYDPANEHIKPVAPRVNKWEIDTEAVCFCMKRKSKRKAVQFCPDFELKITL